MNIYLPNDLEKRKNLNIVGLNKQLFLTWSLKNALKTTFISASYNQLLTKTLVF